MVIFAFILIGHVAALTQNDSVCTIKLQRINDYGNPVEKIINPFNGIKIWTNKNRKIVIDTLKICSDNILITINDSVSFNDIIKIHSKKKITFGQIVSGSIIEIIGLATVLTGYVCLLIHVNTMEDADPDPEEQIRQNYSTGILIGHIGAGIIFTGIRILVPLKRSFNTKRKWIIKQGQFVYKK